MRVIVNGTWGFAATSDLTKDGAATAAAQAAAIARANSRAQTEPVQLAKVKGVGEVAWSTPIRKNAMAVPLKDKAELLLAVNAAALKAGANFVSSNMFAINEQKYFASTDGSYIDQDIHRIWVPFTVTAVDQASGRFRTRDGLSAPMGMGYEYLDGDAPAKFVMPNGVVNYGNSYDMVEDAIAAAQQAREKLKAPSVKPGKYDLVLDPSHLWLTIHESVGHPLELDRVLGYEANFAGTSFATLGQAQVALPLRQRPGDAVRRPHPAAQPRRRRSTTTRASRRSAGTSSRTASWSTTRRSATRPTSSARRARTAAATPTPGPACSSSAWRTSRSRRAPGSSAWPT